MRIIPQLCSVDKIAAQEVALKSQLSMIRRAFSVWLLNHQQSLYFTDQLKLVIGFKSWHSRLAAIQMVQNFGVFNIFLIKDEIKTRIKEIILNSLTDEQLEVRQSACLTLTGFIHSGFIHVDQELIDHLKRLSKIKAKSKDKESGKVSINMANLIKRHGGILGLCSIVNSSPYDVPSYLPDVVTYLCHFINDPVPIQVRFSFVF
jgi:proteasome activator subunit 4